MYYSSKLILSKNVENLYTNDYNFYYSKFMFHIVLVGVLASSERLQSIINSIYS